MPISKVEKKLEHCHPGNTPGDSRSATKTEREILDEKAAFKEQAEALAHALGCVDARDPATVAFGLQKHINRNAKAEEVINPWPGLK